MLRKLFKYVFFVVVLVSLVGAGFWLFSRWMMINESIPEGAMKVLGWLKAV